MRVHRPRRNCYKTWLNVPDLNSCIPGKRSSEGGCSPVVSYTVVMASIHPSIPSQRVCGKGTDARREGKTKYQLRKRIPGVRQETAVAAELHHLQLCMFLVPKDPTAFSARAVTDCSLSSALGCQKIAGDAAVSSIHLKQNKTTVHNP